MFPSEIPAHLDHWQKKFYFNFLILKKSFLKLPLGKRLEFSFIVFIFLSYPGQNYWQTLILRNQTPQVKAASISIDSHPYPINDGTPPPLTTAQAIFIFEPDSGTILLEKNSNIKLHPASTTKIMTALVALEIYNLDDILTVRSGEQAIGHSVKLATNEQFTVKNLLYATLVSSGNDASLTLAESYPDGGYLNFLKLMNQKAQDLHLLDTSFSNVSGIESLNHKTTVHDLAILTKEAVKNTTFMEIVGTPSITISNVTGESKYLIESTNLLLGQVDGLIGIKTGWTENAGECLVTYTIRNNQKIITVVLNSTDRFGESQQLIDWSFTHHTWQNLN